MDWNAAWQTALAIIASVGGAGIIIAGIVKWSADRIAERIIKKKEFEFSQRIEELKSNLEKKNYISKVRFDLEIEIYKELSETTLQMVDDCNSLFLYDKLTAEYKFDRESMNKRYSTAVASSEFARKSIMRNSPFIPEEIYTVFINIANECNEQIELQNEFMVYDEESSVALDALSKFTLRQKETNKNQELLSQKLREHIASLDVLDK